MIYSTRARNRSPLVARHCSFAQRFAVPTRRALGQGPMPGMPMTGSGTSKQMYDDRGPSMELPEDPQTRRRRLTPLTGLPEAQPNAIQQLLAMLKGNG